MKQGDNRIGSVHPSACSCAFEAKNGHYQSSGSACVSVIRGLMRIIIDCVALAKQGDDALGSICPSVSVPSAAKANNYHQV